MIDFKVALLVVFGFSPTLALAQQFDGVWADALNPEFWQGEKEVLWMHDVDDGVTATLVKSSSGATTSDTFRVIVGPSGQELNTNFAVFVADKTDAPTVQLIGPAIIEICYVQSRIRHFSNFQEVLTSKGIYKTIEVELRQSEAC